MTEDLRARLQQALGAEYRIIEELGRGGMSRVFLAQEVALERQVVVKVLPPDLSAELSADRFRREMAIMAQLTHPYVVPILRTSDAASTGLLYYMMPYLAGDTVRTLMTREVQLPIEQARLVAREVALALDFAHRRGIVHRDIKPENVLLVDGHAMVIDFGVARAVSHASADRMTATGLTVGTPNYMSPEQASGEREVDGRSDIFSLGCLLFEMLAGEVPHRGPTAQVTLARRLSEPAPDVTKLRQSVPADLQAVLKRALAPSPADRFRTAGDMALALGATPSDPTRQATLESGALATAPAGGVMRASLLVAGALALAVAAWFSVRAMKGGDAASAPPASVAPTPAAKEPISLAVLPLENRGKPEDEWFGDGLADELRGALSRHMGILVKGSRSSNLFRGTTKPLAEVARELGVRYVVTGTVVWEPTAKGRGRVRVSPELVDVSNESTKWRQSFDTSLTDLFTGQRALGVRVADALAESLVPSSGRREVASASSVTPEAYALFLAGKRELESFTDEGKLRSIDLFRRAIRADSTFAQGYAFLALTLSQAPRSAITDERIPEMLAAMDRASQLAPNDPTVLAARAFALTFRGDFRGALADARRSLALDSTNVWSLWRASDLEASFGHFEESTRLARKASQVDPLVAGDLYMVALMREERFGEAERELRAGLAIDSLDSSNGWQAHRAELAAFRGDLAEFNKASALAARTGRSQESNLYAIALARAGRTVDAHEQLARLVATSPSPVRVAEVYAQLGNLDSAMVWLQRSAQKEREGFLSVGRSGYLAPLRSDPRYLALLRRIGFR